MTNVKYIIDNNFTSNCCNINTKYKNKTFKNNNKYILKQPWKGDRTETNRSNLTHFVFSYFFLILLVTPLVFLLSGHTAHFNLILQNRFLSNVPDSRIFAWKDMPILWDHYFKDRQDIPLAMILENRALADAPYFQSTPWKDLPQLWDRYLRDRIPFRELFMPGYVFTYEKLLRTNVSEYVTGAGDELFMNHAAPVVNAALGIIPYPEQAKEHIRLTAAGKHAYFQSKGIPYYLFLAPDKSTLYHELLPFYAGWISHTNWYTEQVSTLQKANIRFHPLNDYLGQFKDHERLYDVMFDNCHWNGNALKHAYDYMAGTLAKDNAAFRPVAYGEYYSLEDRKVVMSVYGSEDTEFIRLKHTDNFSCSELPMQYRSDGYNKICTNNAVLKSSLWFFSDSYFGETHGSYGVTPFVHNVHTYIHRHYGMGTKPFTALADETLKLGRPDAVIEEYVERMGGTQHSLYDPKLRILGDYWMKTGGIFLDHKTDLSVFSFRNIDRPDPASGEISVQADSRLTLNAPVAADDLGRVVVMGKLNTPANTAVKIFYRDETGTEQTLDFGIAQGSQLFHETIHVKPFSKVNLSLQFLAPGKYRLEKIQEIDDLRERM